MSWGKSLPHGKPDRHIRIKYYDCRDKSLSMHEAAASNLPAPCIQCPMKKIVREHIRQPPRPHADGKYTIGCKLSRAATCEAKEAMKELKVDETHPAWFDKTNIDLAISISNEEFRRSDLAITATELCGKFLDNHASNQDQIVRERVRLADQKEQERLDQELQALSNELDANFGVFS